MALFTIEQSSSPGRSFWCPSGALATRLPRGPDARQFPQPGVPWLGSTSAVRPSSLWDPQLLGGPGHLLLWSPVQEKAVTIVMVNFVYQLDWAMGCPDILSYITLGASVRRFLDEINV